MLASLTPGEILLIVIGLMLALAGFINTMGGAIEKLATAWNALRAPDREQSSRIKTLEEWKEDATDEIKELRDEIKALKDHHEDDMAESREERQLVMFGLVSCLKGLESQGCNGAVPKAIEKIDKYLNEKAHR